jgi:lysophospholipase L1-like esterase
MVAVGDSITKGRGGYPILGIHPQSWAQWVAETLGLPFTNLAADGATAPDLVRDQLPRLSGPYDLATLFVGANDARSPVFDATGFERDVAALTDALAGAADRVLVLTLPLELGRPTAGPDIVAANAILRAHAARTQAVVCPLEDLAGPRHLLPDAVHPTSPGMVAIAERALLALGEDAPVASGESRDLARRAQYGAWYLRQVARDALRRVRER